MDYSKWDRLEVDDDDEGPARPRVTRLAGPTSFTIGPGEKRAHTATALPAPPAARARVTDYERWEEVAKGMSDEEEGGEEEDIDGGPDEHEDAPPSNDGARLGLGAGAPDPVATESRAAVALAKPSASLQGGVTERYVWSQTKAEATINFVVPAATRAKDVRLRVDRDHIALTLAGSDFRLEGELSHAVVVAEDPDELDWELRDPEGGATDCRWLRLTLEKQAPAGVVVWWDRVFAGDAVVDVSAFASRDSNRAAQFEANWKEAHELFRQKVATRQKIELDLPANTGGDGSPE